MSVKKTKHTWCNWDDYKEGVKLESEEGGLSFEVRVHLWGMMTDIDVGVSFKDARDLRDWLNDLDLGSDEPKEE